MIKDQAGSRHDSIIELLSTPPAIPHQASAMSSDLDSISLSRQESTSSLDSQVSNSQIYSNKWQCIQLSQLVEQNKLIFIDGSISMEEAFNMLIKHNLTSLPVEKFPGDINCLTFDYNDLNSYLLLVLNKITIADNDITTQCQSGRPVQVNKIVSMTLKNPFHKLSELDNLFTVVKILGSGVHRVAITDESTTKIKGILSQRRLIKYLWENARQFPGLESLLNSSLKELGIGVLDTTSPPTSRQSRVISIQGDELLIMALYKMHTERISSIAVIDNQGNLFGNISVTDVKHVTRTSQYPLLYNTCLHFISVILNSRGLEMGKDSFPIFHVYPTSSLARTIAKLVATKAHRLWIVQPPEASSPSSMGILSSNSISEDPIPRSSSPISITSQFSINSSTPILPSNFSGISNSNPNSTLPINTDHRTGKLIGVVSLTDILGLFARKHPECRQIDPSAARRQRINGLDH